MHLLVRFLLTLSLHLLPGRNSVAPLCDRKPVVFNFGDSNSDTGGYSAALGVRFGLPHGRRFPDGPSGRLSDGRLMIDFLCESLDASYLSPYAESLGPNFTYGANFAIAGAATLPRYRPFSLDVQVLQFVRFRTRSPLLKSRGYPDLVGEEEFENALYTFDIGQNDFAGLFVNLSYQEAIARIPEFINEIDLAIRSIYQHGGKNFWVHNTGPLGCPPQKLATYAKNASDLDEHGCILFLNNAAKVFNDQLTALCNGLRSELTNATIVYVDLYAIKYELIANYSDYGFEDPLMACCGYGGAPYNYNPNVTCGNSRCTACDEKLQVVSWDGVHYTEAANAVFAAKILSTDYSTPRTRFNFFCRTD
ncbi:hypothetical protein MLD38_026330 [Melastoma candidum]|uniref:Uncharacterized protein n=1 Tax=Melastoma candidum TaxID=119954 RepID=A0ACB9NZA2_9MYRT|nr:hypothetical protein MLD38_026330 [Melastoma candidum]